MTLLGLPGELIDHIASHLDKDGILSIRETCKTLAECSFPAFSKRFFGKIGFLITSDSLERLRAIAQHKEIRTHVQHIWFNPDCFTQTEPPDIMDERDQKRFEAYRACVDDHRALMRTPNLLATLLHESFSCFPNLSVLGMRRSEDHEPFGWRQLRDATGMDPRVVQLYRPENGSPPQLLSEPTQLFIAMVTAAASAKVSLTRLYTDAIEVEDISLDILPQNILESACGRLLYLEINIYRSLFRPTPELPKYRPDTHEAKGALRLFTAARNLRELGLQVLFEPLPEYRSHHTLIWYQNGQRFYARLCLDTITRNAPLSQITRLKLERLATTPEVLKAFMQTSSHCLKSIKLRDIRLQHNAASRPWQTIFEFLRDEVPGLSYLLLYNLKYHGGGLSFIENPPNPVPYLDIMDPSENPNPPFGEVSGQEFFVKYHYIALEASGRDEVMAKVDVIAEKHYYPERPLFSYAIDEDLWHSDTSDEED